jgi:hypothetical protein
MQTSNFYTYFDRDQAQMPTDYLPEAPGVAIAGDPLLYAIGYRPGSRRPSNWSEYRPGVFRHCHFTHKDKMVLQVRMGDAKFWVVERFRIGEWRGPYPGLNLYALVCAHSGRPIWTSSYQAAMRLAHYCHPDPRPPVAGRWVQVREREHTEFLARYEREYGPFPWTGKPVAASSELAP